MEAAPCGIQCGVAVATGELLVWQSSKSVLVGIGQDFDRVVIRAPPHGFLGSRPSLSADAVQAVSDAVSEHCGVWLETRTRTRSRRSPTCDPGQGQEPAPARCSPKSTARPRRVVDLLRRIKGRWRRGSATR